VIMIFFPGPWKHKLWYIPTGILVIHLTNLVRIAGLAILRLPFPDPKFFHFFHDYIFKTFFYVVIFLMWYIWYEKFTLKDSEQ
jgi:exosortase/archaeosortase family protein